MKLWWRVRNALRPWNIKYEAKRKLIKPLVCGIEKHLGKRCPYASSSFCWNISECPLVKSFSRPIKTFITKIPEPIKHVIVRNGMTYVYYAYDNVPKLDFNKIVFGGEKNEEKNIVQNK